MKEHRTFVSLVSFVVIAFWCVPAHAELVFFSTGRSLSVKSHRIDGDSLVLNLRGGGEVVCVPYPEPEPETPPSLPATASVPYAEIIDKVAAEQRVDARLVKAIVQVESAYRERAVSRKGAMGLMQLMPQTARQYAVGNPYDPQSNLEAGVKHLRSLLQRLPLALALAAYNAGEAAVQRYGGMPPYAETRDYVSRVLKLVGGASF